MKKGKQKFDSLVDTILLEVHEGLRSNSPKENGDKDYYVRWNLLASQIVKNEAFLKCLEAGTYKHTRMLLGAVNEILATGFTVGRRKQELAHHCSPKYANLLDIDLHHYLNLIPNEKESLETFVKAADAYVDWLIQVSDPTLDDRIKRATELAVGVKNTGFERGKIMSDPEKLKDYIDKRNKLILDLASLTGGCILVDENFYKNHNQLAANITKDKVFLNYLGTDWYEKEYQNYLDIRRWVLQVVGFGSGIHERREDIQKCVPETEFEEVDMEYYLTLYPRAKEFVEEKVDEIKHSIDIFLHSDPNDSFWHKKITNENKEGVVQETNEKEVGDPFTKRIFFLRDGDINHLERGSIKSSHLTQTKPTSYYSLLLTLITRFPDGCIGVHVSKIFKSQKLNNLQNSISKGGTGLWRYLGKENKYPNSGEKIIHITNDGIVTFKNILK